MSKKKILSRPAAFTMLLALGWCAAGRAQVTVPLMTVTDTEGHQVAQVELGNASSFVGPRLNRKDATLVIGGKAYPIDEIGEIRFSTGVSTGITQVEDKAAAGTRRSGVYTLAGQKVASGAGRLPKGVYVVDGRKTVIR